MAQKLPELYIVYGSESALLADLYQRSDAEFFCIYNSKIPEPAVNKTAFSTVDEFALFFQDLDPKARFSSITFIGAAAKMSNKLFFGNSSHEIGSLITTNVTNYVRLAEIVLPAMLTLRSGCFIYLSSFRSKVGSRGNSLYSASKCFCESFFQTIGMEYGSVGVTSSNIRLGVFDGALFHQLDEGLKDNFYQRIGNQNLGSGKDLIEAIDFVRSNKYTSGGSIDLLGGLGFV